MSLINKKILNFFLLNVLKKNLLNVLIKRIKMSINIKEIDTFKYMINDDYLLDLYIFDTFNNQ